ncbi:MAG: glycerol dehydrogenase [Armatimonadetes bacterium]|nr:glycerol dehydrogenase [Armatimonadota bacterium]
MRQTAVFPGRYVQGEGVLRDLGSEASRLGSRALVVAGGTAARRLVPAMRERWQEHLQLSIEVFRGECSEPEMERLSGLGREHAAELVIGMGGGKVIDTAKAVAREIGRPVVVAPTIASTDAPCSAVSVIYTPGGEFLRYLFLPRNPDLVLVDTTVIAQAPVRFLVAGMGDGLSTWFEADTCRRAFAPNQCGGIATLAGYQLARLCYDTLLEYGVSARAACEAGVVTPALEHVVEANTLLSGVGFECGGLAAAHSIHNGLTVLAATHHHYHGEKVAFGVLAGLFLEDRPSQIVNQVYTFCEAMGLPTTLQELGLSALRDEDLHRVSERACAEGETIHHEWAPMSPGAVFAAIKTADQLGRARRSALLAKV